MRGKTFRFHPTRRAHATGAWIQDASPRRINEIVHGKRGISPDTALRLARAIGTSDRFWMILQTRFDLDAVLSAHEGDLSRIPLLKSG